MKRPALRYVLRYVLIALLIAAGLLVILLLDRPHVDL